MTTHSPVAVRELSADQLFVLRWRQGDEHNVLAVADAGDVQGTIRKFPEALLATRILVCEGASEVGLMRGLDQFLAAQGQPSVAACGCALVDGGGSELFSRALAFQALGYRVATMRDSDVHPTPDLEEKFVDSGGMSFRWREKRVLEDELFLSMSAQAVFKLLELAIQVKEESLVNEHIKTASANAMDLAAIRADYTKGFSNESRTILGKASSFKGKSWFKAVSLMEFAAREIIGPELPRAVDPTFSQCIERIFKWIANGAR